MLPKQGLMFGVCNTNQFHYAAYLDGTNLPLLPELDVHAFVYMKCFTADSLVT